MPIQNLTMKMSIKYPRRRFKILGLIMLGLAFLRIISPGKAADLLEQYLRKNMKYRVGDREWQTLEEKESVKNADDDNCGSGR